MYAGRVVERGPAIALHPYTIALLRGRAQGAMRKGVRLATIGGAPPDLAALPPGCAFAPRCAYAAERCRETQPEKRAVGAAHTVRCIRVDEIAALPDHTETVSA